MGLSSGSLTFFRLYFNETLNFGVTELRERLGNYSFSHLFEEEKQINYGFVPFEYPKYEDFDSSEVLFEENYIFCLRLDEKKISKKYFDIEFIKFKNQFMAENNKQNLTKTDMEFLKNALNSKLFKNSIPSTSLVEVIFKIEQRAVFVSNVSAKIFAALEHLFRLAFDIVLYRDSLVENLRKNSKDSALLDNIIKLTPYNF